MSLIRLSDYLERPALVEQKKKYATFKITPIGGPKEIIKWREEQATKLAAYNIKREELKNKKVEFLAGGSDAPLGELTWQGKALLSDQKTWEQKLKDAKAARKRLLTPEILTDSKAWNEEPNMKKQPTLIKKVTSWFKSLFA